MLPMDCFQIEEVEEGKDMEEAILTTTPSGTLHQYGQMDARRTTTPDDKTLYEALSLALPPLTTQEEEDADGMFVFYPDEHLQQPQQQEPPPPPAQHDRQGYHHQGMVSPSSTSVATSSSEDEIFLLG